MCRAVFVIFCIFAALTPYLANAMTEEQKTHIREHFETIGMTCFKDNVITEEDIANLREKKVPTGPNSGCFLACVMKHIGVMDDAGLIQKENVLELAKSVFNDPDELKLIEDYLHSCKHVNTEAVSDGEKGCERALSAFKCMRDNAPQFGFEGI